MKGRLETEENIDMKKKVSKKNYEEAMERSQLKNYKK